VTAIAIQRRGILKHHRGCMMLHPTVGVSPSLTPVQVFQTNTAALTRLFSCP